jgi:aryl carrier-like protein
VVVDGEVSLEVLRQQLRQRLPDYMLPASLHLLNELPLSANGKADRNALRHCLADIAIEHSDAPQGAQEREMAEVWSEVLQRPIPGRHSDFFLLGGDSLSATRLVETLKRRRVCQAPLSLRELFAHPSIAALCDYLGSPTEQHAEHFEEGTL